LHSTLIVVLFAQSAQHIGREGERERQRDVETEKESGREGEGIQLTAQLSIFSRMAICISHSSLLNFELLQIT